MEMPQHKGGTTVAEQSLPCQRLVTGRAALGRTMLCSNVRVNTAWRGEEVFYVNFLPL